MASTKSICQTIFWCELALRPADCEFIWTHSRPLVPDLLSPLLFHSRLFISLILLPHLLFLFFFVRLVLSCCLRFHMSCSVITCPRHSTRLHIFVGAMMEGERLTFSFESDSPGLTTPHSYIHLFLSAPKLQF